MSVEITAKVVGVDPVSKRFATLPALAKTLVSQELDSLGKALLQKVKRDKLTGQVLNVRTDKLRGSINTDPPSGASDDGKGTLSVSVGTNVWYGRMWELFGHGVIVPKRAKMLSWIDPASKERVFAKQVAAQAPRPFLKPALAEIKPLVVQRLTLVLSHLGSPGSP